MTNNLTPFTAGRGKVVALDHQSWRLTIPPAVGPSGYQLAQLDDYRGRKRRNLPWEAPLRFRLQARASSLELPGTWGFGLWNDPFSLKIGFGGAASIPALPQTAWFFYASQENHLALYDHLPGAGFLTASFHSRPFPAWIRTLAAPGLLALIWPPLAAAARRFSRRFINQDAASHEFDFTAWHTYQLDWEVNQVVFQIDGQVVFSTPCSPAPPLGMVIWIDNQYAAWPNRNKPRFGTLSIPENAWIEIRKIDRRMR